MTRSVDPTPHNEQAAKSRRERSQMALQRHLVATGKALDVKQAMLRCYDGEPSTDSEKTH